MPPWSENRRRQSLSRSNHSLRFRHRPYAFDTSSVVPLRSSSCQSPDLVLPRPFSPVLTTMVFDHSHRRWFGTRSCQPVPRGLPSSIKQLHTLGHLRPFALVAHNHRRIAPVWRPSTAPGHAGTPGQTNASIGWPAVAKRFHPVGYPFCFGSPWARPLAYPASPPQAPPATSESVAIHSDPRCVLASMPSTAGGELNQNILLGLRHKLLGSPHSCVPEFPSELVARSVQVDTRTNNLRNLPRRSAPLSTAWPSAPPDRGSSGFPEAASAHPASVSTRA